MVPGDGEREVNELIMVGWVSSLVNFGILQFAIDNLVFQYNPHVY